MTRRVAKVAACAGLLVSCAALAAGDVAPVAAVPAVATAGATESPLPLPELAAFEQMIAARQVADFARRHKDPQAMAVAARMLQEVPFRDAADTATDGAAFTPNGLFAEAKGFAKGDAGTLMQIAVAQSTGTRGVMSSAFGSGLVRSVQNVAAKGMYRFAIRAKGGEPLRIGAIGDVGTTMMLRLVDGAGKLACQDDNGDYAPVCAVRPAAATSYRVELVNRSSSPSRAVILSN